jgi:hypothetical protein
MVMTMRSWPVVALALAVSACGYALAGRGSSLPDHVRRIGVPMFENQSATPDLDRILTEAVRLELQGRGRFVVVADSTGVDAVLSGTLQPVQFAPAAFTVDRQVSRYLITVVAAIEFRIARDAAADAAAPPFWANPGLRVSDEYDVTGTLALNDPSTIFTQDRNALDRLARAFARTVVTSILENF